MRLIRVIFYLIAPIAVFIISSYFTVSILLKTGETVICPDVRGQKVEDAKRFVESKGLSLVVLRHETRNDVPYGYITVQKPEASITIRKGRVVNVLVSDGPRQVELPILANEPLREAEAKLKEKQIMIEKIIYVPGKKAGRVFAQMPAGGSKALEGSSVILFAGSDPKTYFLMPDTKDADILSLSAEMDSKGIKHKIAYGQGDPLLPGSGSKKTAIAPKTIFSREEEIMLNANGG
ncbi:MAG: hypothetical protein C0392_09935 [Syntrophus sp. (in: bacteria)]|nr:hypothetical protein [Syntrophus sp. (in: bacteria)]